VTVDTTPPAAPVITSPADLSTSVTGNLVVSGTAEAAAQVAVYDAGVVVGSAFADANGAWSLTTSKLADGLHTLTATATDPASNVSAPSAAVHVVVDTIAPVPPVITAPTSSTVLPSKTVLVSGTAEAGSTV